MEEPAPSGGRLFAFVPPPRRTICSCCVSAAGSNPSGRRAAKVRRAVGLLSASSGVTRKGRLTALVSWLRCHRVLLPDRWSSPGRDPQNHSGHRRGSNPKRAWQTRAVSQLKQDQAFAGPSGPWRRGTKCPRVLRPMSRCAHLDPAMMKVRSYPRATDRWPLSPRTPNMPRLPRLKTPRKARIASLALTLVLVVVAAPAASATGARVMNVANLDDGTCGQNLQIGADKTASADPTPSFLLWGDGGLSSYNIFIDGAFIGKFNSDGFANVCITTMTRLVDGPHTLTGNELAPHNTYTVTPFNFSVDTVPPAPPTRPVISGFAIRVSRATRSRSIGAPTSPAHRTRTCRSSSTAGSSASVEPRPTPRATGPSRRPNWRMATTPSRQSLSTRRATAAACRCR